MTAPNILSKAFCYQDLRRIYAICLPPWAWLDKNTPGEIGLNLITYANVCIIRIDTCWFYVKVFWEYTKTNKNVSWASTKKGTWAWHMVIPYKIIKREFEKLFQVGKCYLRFHDLDLRKRAISIALIGLPYCTPGHSQHSFTTRSTRLVSLRTLLSLVVLLWPHLVFVWSPVALICPFLCSLVVPVCPLLARGICLLTCSTCSTICQSFL